MLALYFVVKALRQSRPVAHFHQERDSRVLQHFDEIGDPRSVDLGKFRAT